MDVRYKQWNDPTILTEDEMIINKRVENSPRYLHRAGVNFSFKKISCQGIWNRVGSMYTDALNTEIPSEDATIGKLDGYTVIDASLKYNFSSHLFVQINVNNLADVRYATRRSGGLPGPGLLPGSPRIATATLGVNL
jgi:Fe(3+) dicitrate transport protein